MLAKYLMLVVGGEKNRKTLQGICYHYILDMLAGLYIFQYLCQAVTIICHSQHA